MNELKKTIIKAKQKLELERKQIIKRFESWETEIDDAAITALNYERKLLAKIDQMINKSENELQDIFYRELYSRTEKSKEILKIQKLNQ